MDFGNSAGDRAPRTRRAERAGVVWVGVVVWGEGMYGSRTGTTDVARFVTRPVMNPTSLSSNWWRTRMMNTLTSGVKVRKEY